MRTLSLLVACTFFGATAEAGSASESFALIVANNQPVGAPELRTLRFADDDGAKYYELFDGVTTHIELLTVLDPKTQRVHPSLAEKSRGPTRKNLDRSLARIFSRMRTAKAEGKRVNFYFVYVGHGSINESGEGEVHLLDGRFSRADLYREVIAASPADRNHIVIDACNAYFLVARRGKADRRRASLKRFLAKEDLSHHPNTGFVVSTRKAVAVHEWSGFQSGVFSHEVRSGLTGAADVNGDQRISYPELAAFVAAANGAIKNVNARIEAHIEPPSLNLAEPLFDLNSAQKKEILTIPGDFGGKRYHLEDGFGVRLLDFHLAFGQATHLWLPKARTKTLFLKANEVEYPVVRSKKKRLTVRREAMATLSLAKRGSTAAAFRRNLFGIPFGRDYFLGFQASRQRAKNHDLSASTRVEEPPGSSVRPWLPWIAGGFLGAGATFTTLAAIERGKSPNRDTETLQASNRTIKRFNTLSWVGYAAGAASLLGYLFWPSNDSRSSTQSTSLSVAPAPGSNAWGLVLSGQL